MDKHEKQPLTIAELDVEPIAAEDLATVMGGVGDTCGCIDVWTDNDQCIWVF